MSTRCKRSEETSINHCTLTQDGALYSLSLIRLKIRIKDTIKDPDEVFLEGTHWTVQKGGENYTTFVRVIETLSVPLLPL